MEAGGLQLYPYSVVVPFPKIKKANKHTISTSGLSVYHINWII